MEAPLFRSSTTVGRPSLLASVFGASEKAVSLGQIQAEQRLVWRGELPRKGIGAP